MLKQQIKITAGAVVILATPVGHFPIFSNIFSYIVG